MAAPFARLRHAPRAAALALALAALTTLPRPALAADPAMLIADQVYLAGNDRIVAEGNVEALQGRTRLTATRISFDQAEGTLKIEGPIRITEEGGDTLILADAAELDAELRNGLLSGARMMLSSQVQLAAAQLTRSEDRYNSLYKATVSSCQVCETGKPPLWQIRAKRVTHDEAEGQLYFDEARFEVMGVPCSTCRTCACPIPARPGSRAS